MKKEGLTKIIIIVALVISAVFSPTISRAQNISSSDGYAWGENIGWINLGSTDGDVDVTATELNGYAWGENIGWISFNCSNDTSCATVDYKVATSYLPPSTTTTNNRGRVPLVQ